MTNTKESFLFSHDKMKIQELWSTFWTLSCVFIIGDGGLLVSFVFPIFNNLTLLTESGTWVISAGESFWCHGNILVWNACSTPTEYDIRNFGFKFHDTETNVTLNNIERSCIMTVCPLLIVYVFMCYRIFSSIITFPDLKLTHNGMSMLIYLCIKIMFLVYLINGWVFCFCMAWSEMVLPLCVCVCIKGRSKCSSSSNVNINTVVKSKWTARTTAGLPKLTYLMVYNTKVQGCA